MKRYERLDEARAPDGTVLTLFRHDGDYYIRIGRVELMSTRRHASEERLAELVCAPLAAAAAPRVVVGGLGFGFTLRAALRLLPDDARVTVAELIDAVIRWNQEPAYGLAGDALADPRVSLHRGDVAELLAASPGAFDGIMLDVDNGADAVTTKRNARLYDDAGIATAVAALVPGGRVAYWAAEREDRFATALRRAGLAVEVATAPAYETGSAKHWIYTGTRRSV